jgi:hypothetical protein
MNLFQIRFRPNNLCLPCVCLEHTGTVQQDEADLAWPAEVRNTARHYKMMIHILLATKIFMYLLDFQIFISPFMIGISIQFIVLCL